MKWEVVRGCRWRCSQLRRSNGSTQVGGKCSGRLPLRRHGPGWAEQIRLCQNRVDLLCFLSALFCKARADTGECESEQVHGAPPGASAEDLAHQKGKRMQIKAYGMLVVFALSVATHLLVRMDTHTHASLGQTKVTLAFSQHTRAHLPAFSSASPHTHSHTHSRTHARTHTVTG